MRKNKDPGIIPVRIDTTIPYDMHLDCIKRGFSWTELVKEGYRSKIMTEEGTSKNTIRLKIAEQKLEALMKVIKVKSPSLYDYVTEKY